MSFSRTWSQTKPNSVRLLRAVCRARLCGASSQRVSTDMLVDGLVDCICQPKAALGITWQTVRCSVLVRAAPVLPAEAHVHKAVLGQSRLFLPG